MRSVSAESGQTTASGSAEKTILRFNKEEGNPCNLVFMPEPETTCICVENPSGNIFSLERGLFFRIQPETFGQFTGRTDKNGQKVFEGDILRLFGGKDRGVVLWSDHDQCYFISPNGKEQVTLVDFGDLGRPEYYEVIGNIHDNPELLKGGGRPMTAPTTEGGGEDG